WGGGGRGAGGGAGGGGPVQALDGEVVRLGPAAGEDDLARPRAEHLGQLLPGFLHHPAGAAARGVQGGRVPQVAELGSHRGDRLGTHRRSRRVIQVDRIGAVRIHSSIQRSRRAAYFRLPISSRSCGTTLNRSPTTPKSASSKIGASGSLFTAIIVLDVCMPARCWIAPEMPIAM